MIGTEHTINRTKPGPYASRRIFGDHKLSMLHFFESKEAQYILDKIQTTPDDQLLAWEEFK